MLARQNIMQNIATNHPAWIEIDLAQFKRNVLTIKQFLSAKTKFCLPVKANAYGHGLVDITRAACEIGIDYVGVSCLQEGKILRQAGIKIPILVFGAIHAEQIIELIDHDLEFTIASHFKARLVVDICQRLHKTAKVHLEVDTGMRRTGVQPTTAVEVLNYIQQLDCFILKGIYSHLATADDLSHDFSKQQTANFIAFLQQNNLLANPNLICHLANSAGVCSLPEAHLDMVRPGGLVFGCLPHQLEHIPIALQNIKPCLAIKARVSYYKNVPSGTGISYNHTYITNNKSNILTIPVGYGDGLRRALSNKGFILHNGKRYPIVGNICMDQFMVNLGTDPGYVGDIVTLIGTDQNTVISIDEMSEICNTHPYEILCGFNDRLPRIYK